MTLNPPQDFRGTDKTHRIGLAAARPAAADVLSGTLYFSTDTSTLERSNGTTWVSFGSGGAISDSQLSSNIPRKNGTNAFTGANSFATSPLDLLVGQLKFPATQNSSSDVNTLDDYEEGTWLPTITADGGSSGQAYTSQAGRYTKIGRIVIVDANVILSTLGTLTGNVAVGNLPFVAGGAGTANGVYFLNRTTTAVSMSGFIIAGNSFIHLTQVKVAAIGVALVAQADFANNTQIFTGAAYTV